MVFVAFLFRSSKNHPPPPRFFKTPTSTIAGVAKTAGTLELGCFLFSLPTLPPKKRPGAPGDKGVSQSCYQFTQCFWGGAKKEQGVSNVWKHLVLMFHKGSVCGVQHAE